MTELPFLADQSTPAIPIHALRAGEWSAWAESRGGALRRLAAAHGFAAQPGRILLAPATDGAIERVLFGLGDAATATAMGALAQHLPAGDYRIAAAPREFSAGLVAIAWGLGAYAFDRYKPRKRPAPRLILPDGADLAEVERVVRASWLVRDLVNTPAGEMGPTALAAAAQAVAQRHNAAFECIIGEDLLTQNYPLIHAVGRAAKEAPRLARLSWGQADAPVVALVGKGVTFDSGGLDIKPESGMRLMKKDMGGAAHALALADLVMDARLPVRLEGLLPIVENAIS
ncbi:MAG: leucyl aminopeptidase family protein, partial [Hyphomonadaceae bacterium]